MKKAYNFLICLASLSAVFSCSIVEEIDGDIKEQIEMVEMVFSATIDEGGSESKTVLSGELEDKFRQVLWLPSDEIGVVMANQNEQPVQKFTNLSTTPSANAEFEGSIGFCEEYHAIYPYQSGYSEIAEGLSMFMFPIPTVQKYVPNSFDTNAAPMVGKCAYGETMKFKNLCGVLALNLIGEEEVRSITFMGRDSRGEYQYISGDFVVDMSYATDPFCVAAINEPSAFFSTDCYKSVTLTCDAPVALSLSEETTFYFLLPPATYNGFVILVTTANGKTMIREGKNPLTINRAKVKLTTDLEYAETVTIDLSERGNANCYIVPKAGMYSFETHVVGNGEHGYIENASFYPATPEISPVKAELLWEDKSDVISGISLENNRISFLASGLEGNALIAAKDENDNILWSWHIWVTDQPQDQVYENSKGTFTMLDRNIGATRADRGTGEQWREGSGLQYQWGRKDPFAESKYITLNTQLSVGETIQMPTHFAAGNGRWTAQWNNNFWSTNQKTIYDPCPVGYRVAVPEVWCDFTTTGENVDRSDYIYAQGEFDNGWNFIYDGSNTAWYSANNEVNYWGGFDNYSNQARIWSAENTGNSKYLGFSYTSQYECYVYLTNSESPVYAYSVRCMKDEGHVDTSYPTVKLTSISDITSESAHVTANVTDHGISEITERGILYSTSAEITVDNATKVTIESGDGEYSADLTGLAHSTRYYVRAYAINERGISYSKEMSFYTPYSGSAVDLSANGTANCYIVPPIYSTYTFDCTVKGNSMISVGTPAEAVVLWETRNDTNPINVGDVIESITLEGDKVKFLLPFEPKPGNALVAVKDANGTILWSWHIWVTDYDPVETQQKYINGAIMMDRNLGALELVPSSENSENYKAYGLYYQWSRKDPSPVLGAIAPTDGMKWHTSVLSYDSIEASIQYPNVFVANSSWNNTQYWTPEKSIYDPCPAGWKVAEKGVWNGISQNDLTVVNNTHRIIPEPYSVPQACYPMSGEYYSYWPGISDLNNVARLWCADVQEVLDMYWEGHMGFRSTATCQGIAVRCMKIMPTQGGNEGYTGSDYEW